jgi:hypothetical protein
MRLRIYENYATDKPVVKTKAYLHINGFKMNNLCLAFFNKTVCTAHRNDSGLYTRNQLFVRS